MISDFFLFTTTEFLNNFNSVNLKISEGLEISAHRH